ncbi:sulfatase-like hydrolase/transferase [Pontiella sp.]|uniref:sulfatase-like hydrolase/transferase n=1 Tax=Pontiella sp. TaxID=2837462 RepID=UPI003566836F
MKTQHFGRVVAAALMGLTLAASAAQRNILVIIADDIGLDSLSRWNSDASASFPPVPTIEALAGRGITFTQAYANPTCSPTRAAILTGRNGWRTGVLSPSSSDLPASETTLPELFAEQQLGYELASFGKWHLGGGDSGPNDIGGWPHFSGSLGGALGLESQPRTYYNWTKVVDGVSTALTDAYATSENVTDAVDWIGEQGTNRWFAWIGFNAAHTPYHKPPADLHTYSLPVGAPTNNPRPHFEAMIESMDTEMGRLLAGIDTNETTIIFLGDNGTAADVIQPPYDITGRAKGTLYEGGTHVPMIVAGPDVVDGGRTNDSVVHCADLFATILELAGGTLPASGGEDSRSLVPILGNQPFAPANDWILMESDALLANTTTGRAIRNDQYKLIRMVGRADKFYDMGADPLESTNLLDGTLSAAEQAVYDAFSAQLDSWVKTEVVVYVDADNTAGPWDGASWTSAYATVQAGIDAASSAGGGAVWVAEGIYLPTTDSDRTASFTMAGNVDLYGGFAGTETDRAQRDPSLYASVLSGDIGVSGVDADNSYHVVIGASDAVLDGFTIRDGQADGARQNQHGGGLYCVDEVSPTVVGCTFADNQAGEGAGVYAYNASSSDFSECEFTGNTANRGGALLLRNGCSGTFSNCTFSANFAAWAGGAIYADYGSSPTFSGCAFANNSTTGKGGAFFTDDLASQVGISSPVFVDCAFTGNSATYRGGGIYNFDGSETSVANSSFTGNSAGIGGGAIANDLNSELTLSGVTYAGNSSTSGEADVDSDGTSVVY